MNQRYFSLLTKLGQARIINAQALGKTINLTTLKIGDGGDDNGVETSPKETDTALIRERWQGPINHIYQDPKNQSWLIAETVIPEDDGNFYVTEFGVYDDDDNLIIIGKYPKTYKPTLAEGSGSSLYMKVGLELSNADTVELKVDPAIVLASRTYVDHTLLQHLSNLPVYPNILTADHTLKITQHEHAVLIAPNQSICWRGWKMFNTTDYLEAERRFDINPDKTYHLRWTPTHGFQIKDVADTQYNPDQVAESDSRFDTTYDDMLVARIDQTLTPLINKPKLLAKLAVGTSHGDIVAPVIPDNRNTDMLKASRRLNWSRTSCLQASLVATGDAETVTGAFTTFLEAADEDFAVVLNQNDRYGFAYEFHADYTLVLNMEILCLAI